MLRDRLAADGQARGEGGRRRVALTERREDAPAGLVAERGEHRDQRCCRHEPASRKATSLSSSELPAAAVALEVRSRVGGVLEPGLDDGQLGAAGDRFEGEREDRGAVDVELAGESLPSASSLFQR